MSDQFIKLLVDKKVGIHQILYNLAAHAKHQPPETVDGK
jgi:hypothetical protein